MKRALTPVLVLAAALAAAAQQPSSIDPVKLERIRKLSPEERNRLKERLVQLKTLPREEKIRLEENLKRLKAMPPDQVRNLREKVTQLTPDERKEYTELASGFFKWAQRRGLDTGFPRGLFFTWLKNNRPAEIQRIREMERDREPHLPDPRVDAFMKLTVEFRNDVLARLESHVRQHRCVDLEDVQALKDAPPEELWARFHALQRSCATLKARPGPVAPHPEGKPRK